MKKIILLILFLSILLNGQIIQISDQEKKALGVKTQKVQSASTLKIGSFNAKIVLSVNDVMVVDAKFAGIIEKIYVQNYSVVQKNQPLFKIKSPALSLLQQKHIAQSLALKAAKKNYKRDKRLEKRGVISQKRLLESKTRYKSELAAFELSKEQLRVSGLSEAMIEHLEKSQNISGSIDIHAPQEGEILALEVMLGEYVQPSSELLKIYKKGEYFLDITVPLEYADKISLNDVCLFRGERMKILSISHIVDAASQSIIVRAKLPNSSTQREYQLNRILNIEILKHQTQAFKIKKSSLVYKDADAFVFKRHQEGFDVVGVKVLSEEDEHYIIEAQIQESDELAINATAALLSVMEDADE